jgi:hypothetical protein
MKSASEILSHALLALGCACCFLPPGQAADVADCSLVPGWRQEGAPRHYTAENLYEYIDGSAEAYLLYGFQQLQGVTCDAGEDSIVIDASEMTDAEAAYGLFAANRDPRRPIEKIGMGGQILAQRAAFAKGNYYIELTATPDYDHTPALTAVVAALDWVTGVYDATGGVQKIDGFTSTFQAGDLDPFLTGRVAMKIDGNWVLNIIGTFKRDLNFGVAPAPMPRSRLDAGKPYISWAGGWSWV